MADIALDLRNTIANATSRLESIPIERAREPVSPGKWSPQEIIGHLVDSASNNHGRFVRAQLTDDLEFSGYDQEAWVRLQQYSTAEWADLLTLWRQFNFHIAHVIERIPPDVATRARTQHNLDQIAWKTVPRDTPVTLEYFVRDYVAHLKHHLAQIPS
ncbi:MAG TPA: DinB family protein [Gemmatimonadaceae bacterium]|nr:DinB family protein [Gemmatimonadaceae bacterium]